MPGPAVISADGSTVSWTLGGTIDEVQVYDASTKTYPYESYPGLTVHTSPFTIPASAYPTTGTNYDIGVELANTTTSITGADSASSYGLIYTQFASVSK
jgi:hypothetical protein